MDIPEKPQSKNPTSKMTLLFKLPPLRREAARSSVVGLQKWRLLIYHVCTTDAFLKPEMQKGANEKTVVLLLNLNWKKSHCSFFIKCKKFDEVTNFV